VGLGVSRHDTDGAAGSRAVTETRDSARVATLAVIAET
jgi:hypothetical protein